MFAVDSEAVAERLVLGATVMGTGGGGSPAEGLRMLREVVASGLRLTVIDVEELQPEALVVVPYYVGSIAPGLRPKKPTKIANAVAKAFEVIEKELGERVGAVVASELGGENTAVALATAARLGVPALDGDLLGRAAPKLHQCTVHIFGIPMYPSVAVSETGNVVVVREYADIDDYEALVRHLSVLSGRYVAVVDTPMRKSEAEKAVVKGSITLCIRLGDAILRARAEGGNPVEKAAEVVGGWVVFKGLVESYRWRNEGGFLIGEAVIKGVGRFRGKVLKSWIMNEHIMVWLDGAPLVMPPDLFMLLLDDGEPVTNTELKEGMLVNGLAARAPPIWRTPRGLELFGPKHFGFDYEYVPVEELIAERGVA